MQLAKPILIDNCPAGAFGAPHWTRPRLFVEVDNHAGTAGPVGSSGPPGPTGPPGTSGSGIPVSSAEKINVEITNVAVPVGGGAPPKTES